MQKIINFSKYLVLVILSCGLITTWYGTQTEVINLIPTTYERIDQGGKEIQGARDNGESIWKSMSREFTLDTKTQSRQVQAEIRKMLADGRLNAILKAAVPYIYFIRQQTKARGLPTELALIPVIESEFNPYDRSRVGATGLWQLMSKTAGELGVKVRSGYDGRRNVTASTKAALAYFKDLGQMFKGNWLLAIAAYNCGQFRVLSAVRKTGNHSFWNLPLPQETKYYVPRLLAVAAIIKNPEKYGVILPHVSNKPVVEPLVVSKPVNMEKVARTTGVSVETLHKLNPDYNRGSNPKVNPKKEMHTILVPANKVPDVKATLGI